MTSALPVAYIPGFPFWALRDRLKERAIAVAGRWRPDSDTTEAMSAARSALLEHGDPLPLALETLAEWRHQALGEVSRLGAFLQDAGDRAPWLSPPSRREVLRHLQDLERAIQTAPLCAGEVTEAALASWHEWHHTQSSTLNPDAAFTPVDRDWLSGGSLMVDYEKNEIACCVNGLSGDLPDERPGANPILAMDDAAATDPLGEMMESSSLLKHPTTRRPSSEE